MQTAALDGIGRLLAEPGFDGLVGTLRVPLDGVMKLKRRRAQGRPLPA